MKTADRLAALEAALIVDPEDATPILVRVNDARRDGRGLLPDSEITGLRHGISGRLTKRRPGESLADLTARAVAAEPERPPMSRPVLLAAYRA